MDEQQIQEQVVQLVQAAMLGDQLAQLQIEQIMLAAQLGDQQAQQLAQMIQQVAQAMLQQQVQAAKFGAKLRYIRSLRDSNTPYFKKGGKACCVKKHDRGGVTNAPVKRIKKYTENTDLGTETTSIYNDGTHSSIYNEIGPDGSMVRSARGRDGKFYTDEQKVDSIAKTDRQTAPVLNNRKVKKGFNGLEFGLPLWSKPRIPNPVSSRAEGGPVNTSTQLPKPITTLSSYIPVPQQSPEFIDNVKNNVSEWWTNFKNRVLKNMKELNRRGEELRKRIMVSPAKYDPIYSKCGSKLKKKKINKAADGSLTKKFIPNNTIDPTKFLKQETRNGLFPDDLPGFPKLVTWGTKRYMEIPSDYDPDPKFELPDDPNAHDIDPGFTITPELSPREELILKIIESERKNKISKHEDGNKLPEITNPLAYDQLRRIAENRYHSKMADNYFNGKGDGNVLDYVKGAYHWIMSKPMLGGNSEEYAPPITGTGPGVGIGKASNVLKLKEALKGLTKAELKNLKVFAINSRLNPKTEQGAEKLLYEARRIKNFKPSNKNTYLPNVTGKPTGPEPENPITAKKYSWEELTQALREMGDDWWSLP